MPEDTVLTPEERAARNKKKGEKGGRNRKELPMIYELRGQSDPAGEHPNIVLITSVRAGGLIMFIDVVEFLAWLKLTYPNEKFSTNKLGPSPKKFKRDGWLKEYPGKIYSMKEAEFSAKFFPINPVYEDKSLTNLSKSTEDQIRTLLVDLREKHRQLISPPPAPSASVSPSAPVYQSYAEGLESLVALLAICREDDPEKQASIEAAGRYLVVSIRHLRSAAGEKMETEISAKSAESTQVDSAEAPHPCKEASEHNNEVSCKVERYTYVTKRGLQASAVKVTCSLCGYSVNSSGDGKNSVNRCFALLRENCPKKQPANFYIPDDVRS